MITKRMGETYQAPRTNKKMRRMFKTWAHVPRYFPLGVYTGKYERPRKNRRPWPWGSMPPKRGKNPTHNYCMDAPETVAEIAGRIAMEAARC